MIAEVDIDGDGRIDYDGILLCLLLVCIVERLSNNKKWQINKKVR